LVLAPTKSALLVLSSSFFDVDVFAMDIFALAIQIAIGAFVASIRGFESAHRWA
tara:strand:- start:96 stop:257 length:162 start_codon:yes stop_codon:yes gene_type:complete